MIESNETFRLNCTARYLLNETNINPISIYDRYPQCELQRRFMPIFLYIVRTFMLIWLISGIFGNILSFLIWISKQQRRKNSSAIYLATLSLTDFILILLLLNYDLERYWCVRGVTILPGICQIFQCLFIFTQYYSIVLVFGFTLERYLAVCFPFKRHKLCTTKRAILAVVILSLFIIGPILSQGILWTYENGECRMRIHVAMDNRFQTLLFIQEVFFSLVIPIATLIFNILVLCEMKRLIKSSNLLKISKHYSNTSSNIPTTTTTSPTNTNTNTNINTNIMHNQNTNDQHSFNALTYKRFNYKQLFKYRKSTNKFISSSIHNNNENDFNRKMYNNNNNHKLLNESLNTPNFSPIKTSSINSTFINPNTNSNTNTTKESSQFISATLMLIILSFYLIACTVPTGIVYLIQFHWLQPDDCLTDDAIHQSNEWKIFFQRITTKGLIDAFCASHYACNFFIYFLTCNGFKKQALNIIKCKFTLINYSTDYTTETLILSRRTAPRSLRHLSENDSNLDVNHKPLLIYNNNNNNFN
ncbi:hypothetical protein MN116_005658 [Schistosoma mekongi]|uniref:G-protein coupled receptors family 1 profile domain-containing protein n=1 Tax=Schistosoma mekongi TaxID=38744 RepID=A0AAE1ZAX0_SCHME|nr:hypothetical protein MN116_005658 [Schistosoma mekongi]